MSGKKLFFEEVNVGDDIPTVTRGPITYSQSARWGGAVEDCEEIHYDEPWCKAHGLPGALIAAPFLCAYLTCAIEDWMGEDGFLAKLDTTCRVMTFPGDKVFCKGKVTGKHTEGGRHAVELDVSVEKEKGERAIVGTAIVFLPSKASGRA